MRGKKILCAALAVLSGTTLWAQTRRSSIEVDYSHPRKYVVGGVGVEGNQYFNEHQILQLTGLQAG